VRKVRKVSVHLDGGIILPSSQDEEDDDNNCQDENDSDNHNDDNGPDWKSSTFWGVEARTILIVISGARFTIVFLVRRPAVYIGARIRCTIRVKDGKS